MLTLDPPPEVITFDCYGTLVRWHQALAAAAHAILVRRFAADASDAARLVAALREAAKHEQQRVPHRTYASVLRTSLDQAMEAAGHAPQAGDGDSLLAALHSIPPHPEVPATLARLRTRYRIAIISNSDDGLIAETVAGLGAPIDFVITAEQAQAYKPDHRLFQYAHAKMGVNQAQTIHVGMGQFTDLKVCHERGIRAVWINRAGEALDPPWRPDAIFPDLTGLPALLMA